MNCADFVADEMVGSFVNSTAETPVNTPVSTPLKSITNTPINTSININNSCTPIINKIDQNQIISSYNLYINNLHDYNNIKDAVQIIIGFVNFNRKVNVLNYLKQQQVKFMKN